MLRIEVRWATSITRWSPAQSAPSFAPFANRRGRPRRSATRVVWVRIHRAGTSRCAAHARAAPAAFRDGREASGAHDRIVTADTLSFSRSVPARGCGGSRRACGILELEDPARACTASAPRAARFLTTAPASKHDSPPQALNDLARCPLDTRPTLGGSFGARHLP